MSACSSRGLGRGLCRSLGGVSFVDGMGMGRGWGSDF